MFNRFCNFFNLNHDTKKEIFISSYLTLTTLNCLLTLVMGNSSEEAMNYCRDYIENVYQSGPKRGVDLIGLMLSPAFALLNSNTGLRSREEIARDLSSQ